MRKKIINHVNTRPKNDIFIQNKVGYAINIRENYGISALFVLPQDLLRQTALSGG